MRAGERASFWSYNGDEGDVHFGTLLAIHGDRAIIKEGTRTRVINKHWIFETWLEK